MGGISQIGGLFSHTTPVHNIIIFSCLDDVCVCMSMMVYTVQKNMNNETMSSDDNSDSGGSSSFSEEEEVFEDVIANPQNEDDEEDNRVFRK